MFVAEFSQYLFTASLCLLAMFNPFRLVSALSGTPTVSWNRGLIDVHICNDVVDSPFPAIAQDADALSATLLSGRIEGTSLLRL
jgi:hypothetical protein